MLIVESGHGRGREGERERVNRGWRLVYTSLWSSGQRQHEAAARQPRGALSFSFIVGCLAVDAKSHDTKSHDGTFTSQRLGALQEQITGWGYGDL